MEFEATGIHGLIHFRPTPHVDDRGFFSRTFDADVARRAGVDPDAFVQDSQSRSRRGVVRGMHLRVGRGEGKLVRCAHGAIFDVVVDLRPGSPTHRVLLTFRLDGEAQDSLYIPPGCAHGFQALTETADTAYRIDRAHDPTEALAIAWDDPELAIDWPFRVTAMSDADRTAPPLSALGDRLREVEVAV